MTKKLLLIHLAVIFGLTASLTSCSKDDDSFLASNSDNQFFEMTNWDDQDALLDDSDEEGSELETRGKKNKKNNVVIPPAVMDQIQADYPGFTVDKAKAKYQSYEVKLRNSWNEKVELRYTNNWDLVIEKGESRVYNSDVPQDVRNMFPGYIVRKASEKFLGDVTYFEVEFRSGSLKKEVYFDENWDILFERIKYPKFNMPLSSVPSEAIDQVNDSYPDFSVYRAKNYGNGSQFEVEFKFGATDIKVGAYFDEDWNLLLIK